MYVKNIMVENVVTVKANAKVREAAELMNKHSIGCLIVQKEGKPVGIVTERDLLKRVLAISKNPEKIKVKEIMSAPIVAVEPNMEIEKAAKLMFDMKVKKLPVVENGRLVGLVTLTDLVRSRPKVISVMKEITTTQFTPKRIRKVVDYYVELPALPLELQETPRRRIKVT